MPPKKRALTEGDSNKQPKGKRAKQGKKTANEAATGQENIPEATASGTVPRPDTTWTERPYEYICYKQPFFDFAVSKKADPNAEDDELEHDTMIDAYNVQVEKNPELKLKPADDHPEWKWIMSRQGVQMHSEDCMRRAQYCNPDLFDMHVYNRFHAYGILKIVQHMLLCFDKEYKKYTKSKDKTALYSAWAAIAALGWWLADGDDIEELWRHDDGDAINATIETIGVALVTMCDLIDSAGELKKDSEIRDLGLVMTLYLHWAREYDDEFGLNKDEENYWRLIAYAQKAEIDLETAGCAGMKDILKKVKVPSIEGESKGERWNWSKRLSPRCSCVRM